MPSITKPRWLTEEYATRLLEVGLHQGDERAVDDPDDGQRQNDRRERSDRSRADGKSGMRKPKEPERPHLEHDAGEDHRARGRRLDVRIGQPGVEREHRHFDREREEERHEQSQSVAGDERGRVRRRHQSIAEARTGR